MPKALSPEYIAGIIDGEGCVSIYHQEKKCGKIYFSYNVRIMIGMTDDRVIKILQEQYGGSIWEQKQREGWKNSKTWYLTGKKVEGFLNDILPFLIIKKDQARLALELREHINKRKRTRKGFRGLRSIDKCEMEYRKRMKDKMHVLNKKGVDIQCQRN